MKQTFVMSHDTARARALEAVRTAPEGFVVTVAEPTRNSEQNALLWVYLTAFAEQLEWPVNGAMVKLTAEEFKDVLTAAFQGETVRLAMGLNGGVVMLGLRTSQMGKRRFSEWLDFLNATAALRGVTVYADEAAA